MKKKTATKGKRTTAFNPYFVLWLLGFGFSLWGFIYLCIAEHKLSWVLLAFIIIFAIAVIADSMVYVFSKEGICFVTLWGHKRHLPWHSITSIVKHRVSDALTFDHLSMGYEVYYDQPYKGKLIKKTLLLALTPKVKKCLHTFYRGEIRFETQRKKKKR